MYSQPSSGAGMAPGDQLGGPSGAPPSSSAAAAPEGDADQPFSIPAGDLPPGIKEGDCLRCVSMDNSGCQFTLEPAGADSDAGGTSWEDDFRKSMSPASPQEGAT